MLQELSSRQVAEWMAFATMEQVGNPLPPEPKEAKNDGKVKRARIESSLRIVKKREQERKVAGNGGTR